MAFATVEELEARWRSLTPNERKRAAVLLEDAAIMLEPYAKEASYDALRSVSCAMVRRSMTTDGDAFGLDGQSMPSAGWGDSLPAGDLYIKAQERRMLSGCGSIRYIRAAKDGC